MEDKYFQRTIETRGRKFVIHISKASTPEEIETAIAISMREMTKIADAEGGAPLLPQEF